MRVLLTNDDGIEASGLQTLRRALLEVPEVELAVIAPDGNRSAMARSITTRRPLWVQEVDFGDGTVGLRDRRHARRLRASRQPRPDQGFHAELVVSGINHGSNLGDDITYSGTVAAALEAIVLGLPGIAVSQQSSALELDFRSGRGFDFSAAATFTARLVAELERRPAAAGHAAQHQRARRGARGRRGRKARQAHLPRRARARGRGPSPAGRAGSTGSTATPAMSATRRARTSPPLPRGRSR